MTQIVLDFSNEDDAMIQRMATEAVESGEFSNWDHAYESIWQVFEQENEHEKVD